MSAALTALHECIEVRSGLTYEEFEKCVSGYEIIPISDNGEVIGAVMIKGAEIHVGMKRTPKGALRGVLRKVLDGVINKHGYVETMVMRDNIQGIRFCGRLGFMESGRDKLMVFYRRGKPC